MALLPLNGAVPSRFAKQPSGMLSAAKAGISPSFAVVGYKGRNWWLKWQGDNILLKEPGTNKPVQTLDVVIIGISNYISKNYYGKTYVEGSVDRPDCYSVNGIAPEMDAPNKQSATCGTCPLNQWGSRISAEGKRAKECADSRRIVVVPVADIANDSFGGPMLLRIPATSMQNLSKYADKLLQHGADFPWVATKLAFDYSVAYPKIVFDAEGRLDDNDCEIVAEVMKNPLIGQLLDAGTSTIEAEPVTVQSPLRLVKPVEAGGGDAPTEPGEEEEEEEKTPPAPPVEDPPPAAAEKVNPFQGATKAAAVQAAPTPAPAATKRASAKVVPVQAAPSDLEDTINSILRSKSAS